MGTTLVPLRRKHEVIDDELIPLPEELREGYLSFGTVEVISLLDFLPRQFAPLPAQFIAELCEFFLLRQKRFPRRQPLVVGHHRMFLGTVRHVVASIRGMIIFNQVVEHNLDHIYGAIADPTRRAILAMLANGEVNVGQVVDEFSISFNGISKHVKVLERAGLIERTVAGREHRLRLNPKPLRDAAQWLDDYREFWEMRLDALEAFLTGQPPAKRKRRSSR